MSIVRLAALASLIIPAAAAAQSMNAETFHRKATALKAKGPLALFSGDLKLLTNEAKGAGQRNRELRLAAGKAGHKPRYCPPEGPQAMGNSEFMARLGAIPAADRARIDMTEAMARVLAAKFPCPR